MSHPDPLYDEENTMNDDCFDRFDEMAERTVYPWIDDEGNEWDVEEASAWDEEYDDGMDGDFDSGMASAGHGTDEDYGYYGGDDEYGYYGEDY